jgi:uncharacterized membrane protein
MGWFSSKRKVHVSTEIVRVFEDKNIVSLKQKALVDSIFENVPVPESIVNKMLSSHIVKVNNIYAKAKRGDYYYGTPNHNMKSEYDGLTAVRNTVESQLGLPITVDYFHYGPLNNIHRAWQILTEDYGYIEFSNQVTALSESTGATTWVKNIVGHVDTTSLSAEGTPEEEQIPDASTLAVWGRHPHDRYMPNRQGSPEPNWLIGENINDGATVYLVDANGTETELFMDFDGLDDGTDYFQMKYQYVEGGVYKRGYFTYKDGSREYPLLDLVYTATPVGSGSFFPIFFFRSGSKNMTAESQWGTEAYKTSVQLMNDINMDYQTMGDAINENPEADKIEQAVMMMGVPPQTDNPAEAEYLYKFFDWLYRESPHSVFGNASNNFGQDAVSEGRALVIQDSDFSATLSYSRMYRNNTVGSIGEVGTYKQVDRSITKSNTVTRRIPGETFEDPDTYETVVVYYEASVLAYQFQVTPGLYYEYVVDGLKMVHAVAEGKVVLGEISSGKILIPLDYEICQTMRFDMKEELYYRSLHFVFNAKTVTRTKWYQTGVLTVVIAIVAIAIMVFTAGAGTPLSLAMADVAVATGAAATAAAIGTVALIVATNLITSYLIGMVLQKGFEVVIKELGLEGTFIASIVAVVVAVYQMATGGDWSKAMFVASNLQAAEASAAHDVLMDYKAESQEFNLLAEEKFKELEEVNDLLNQYPLLDPRSFIRQEPMNIAGETPDALYNRTVHSGNIGIVQYDYIESYVDINTQLPTFNDSVGDTLYV